MYFNKRLAQSTSLEHSSEYFTRTLTRSVSLELSHQQYTKYVGHSSLGSELKYEAQPQSKFPWGRVQKQNTIAWKYLLQQIRQVFSFFSTYSPPELRHLSYRGTKFCILCRRSLPPGMGAAVFWCQLLRYPPGAQFP
jgi:hypothetical protein